MKKVAGSLRLGLAQYRELAAFAQFGSDLDEATKKQVERGKRLTELLKQPQFDPIPVGQQIALIYAGTNGLLDPVAAEHVSKVARFIREDLQTSHQELVDKLATADSLDEALEAELKTVLEKAIAAFKPE